MNGWITIHRKLINWEWYTETNTKCLFLHCLLMANHEDKNYRGKMVKRGEFLTSHDVLAQQLGLTRQNIRTAISNLKSTNELTIKSTRKGTVIQVVNYDHYQKLTNSLTNNQPTNQPTANQQVTSNNNTNNDNNTNKLIKDIVSFLNEQTGKKLKPTNQATKRHINARIKEGYVLEDFKKVIQLKVKEWKGTDMEKYIRPETLFGTKFEGYLNQEIAKQVTKPKIKPLTAPIHFKRQANQ